MGLKVVFVGNPLAGDDGIGPFLFRELRGDPRLRGHELLELGTVGFDLLSYVDDHDALVIVDAVLASQGVGEVVLLGEDDLASDARVVSQHDIGVEQAMAFLRSYRPSLQQVRFIAVKVSDVRPFGKGLSAALMDNMASIKESVVGLIGRVAGEVAGDA